MAVTGLHGVENADVRPVDGDMRFGDGTGKPVMEWQRTVSKRTVVAVAIVLATGTGGLATFEVLHC